LGTTNFVVVSGSRCRWVKEEEDGFGDAADVTAASKQWVPSLLLLLLKLLLLLGDAATGVLSEEEEVDDEEENAGDKAFKRNVEVLLVVFLRW
jgi:hypothetical protein